MRNLVRSALLTSLLAFAASASADLSEVPSGNYGLDKTHAYISFTYSHLGFSNPHVGFNSFDVDLSFDSDNLANSAVAVTIDAKSVDSRVDEFNEHLNDEDLFDTENYPTITFNSTNIKWTGDNALDVTGDLTIKGTTRAVTLRTKINKAANHPMAKLPTIGISAMAKVSRSEFGLSVAVPMVSDEVTIYIEAELPFAKE